MPGFGHLVVFDASSPPGKPWRAELQQGGLVAHTSLHESQSAAAQAVNAFLMGAGQPRVCFTEDARRPLHFRPQAEVR